MLSLARTRRLRVQGCMAIRKEPSKLIEPVHYDQINPAERLSLVIVDVYRCIWKAGCQDMEHLLRKENKVNLLKNFHFGRVSGGP